MRVLVFDTETTGLPQTKILNPDTLHQWPTIVQFSYIIYDTLLSIFVTLVIFVNRGVFNFWGFIFIFFSSMITKFII